MCRFLMVLLIFKSHIIAWYYSTIFCVFLCSAVSAFYAECLRKKIQFNAHIWTKSKFLGMSIGVHNIGQGTGITASYTLKSTFLHTSQYQLHNMQWLIVSGCVSCLEHDEHYILTFPNGYGRFVLCLPVSVFVTARVGFTDHKHLCPDRFWRCRGWSWVGSAASPVPSRATMLALCSTPNRSTEGRSTGSLLRFCK